MLNAEDKQFRLAEDGQITFQAQASNPLQGEAVAFLEKGESILKPKVVVLNEGPAAEQDKAALSAHIEGWLARHLAEVLEPLVALENTDDLKGPSKGIAFQVHEALGIVPREGLEDLISDLDADDRRDLRGKKIRLGPILVFIPALNKPAAVRLRALLWGLYNEQDLPMECPKDGIVSFEIDKDKADKAFYQAIAYPIYGGRAIRIDMLDRVISAVYDSAEQGKFQAQHKMAEWLGCTIDGLYEILEAMGHKKVYDPADEKKEGEVAAEASAVETSDTPPEAEAPKAEETTQESAEPKPAAESAPAPEVKPELATFRLKKGKAFAKSGGSKKPFKKKDGFKDGEKKHKGKRNKSTNRSPKIMSAGPEKKLEDSPFAILEQLKQQSNEKS